MKKLFLLIAVAFTFSFAYCGEGAEKKAAEKNLTFKGSVVDAKTGEELVGVAIMVDDQVVYTDFNGEFTAIKSDNKQNVITANYISYKSTSIDLDKLEKDSFVISMMAE